MPNTEKNIEYTMGDVRDCIYGYIRPPLMPCEKCGLDVCEGVGACDGYGAYYLGLSL